MAVVTTSTPRAAASRPFVMQPLFSSAVITTVFLPLDALVDLLAGLYDSLIVDASKNLGVAVEEVRELR